MVWYHDTLWCDGCGVEIRWAPLEKSQHTYCCQKCLKGEECDCEEYLDEYPANVQKSEPSIPLTNT